MSVWSRCIAASRTGKSLQPQRSTRRAETLTDIVSDPTQTAFPGMVLGLGAPARVRLKIVIRTIEGLPVKRAGALLLSTEEGRA